MCYFLSSQSLDVTQVLWIYVFRLGEGDMFFVQEALGFVSHPVKLKDPNQQDLKNTSLFP